MMLELDERLSLFPSFFILLETIDFLHVAVIVPWLMDSSELSFIFG